MISVSYVWVPVFGVVFFFFCVLLEWTGRYCFCFWVGVFGIGGAGTRIGGSPFFTHALWRAWREDRFMGMRNDGWMEGSMSNFVNGHIRRYLLGIPAWIQAPCHSTMAGSSSCSHVIPKSLEPLVLPLLFGHATSRSYILSLFVQIISANAVKNRPRFTYLKESGAPRQLVPDASRPPRRCESSRTSSPT